MTTRRYDPTISSAMTEGLFVRRPRAGFITLGCKVNQYESARIAEELWERGFDIAGDDEPLDVCVVNTCSVTQVAAAKSRNAIRRIRRRCPRALIVVTGCGTEADRSAVESVPEIDLVVANSEKDRIADYILERFAGQGGVLFAASPLRRGLFVQQRAREGPA